MGEVCTPSNLTRTMIGYGNLKDLKADIQVVEHTGRIADDKGRVIPYTPVSNLVLVRNIGRGGMGRVDLALEVSDGEPLRALAVKRPVCPDEELEAALIEEYKTNRRLPTLKGVLTPEPLIEIDGAPAIVMPYISSDLEKLMLAHCLIPSDDTSPELWDQDRYLLKFSSNRVPKKQRITRVPDKLVGHILYMTARTLDELGGLIHRDISPGNILLAPNVGGSWLSDFGIAGKVIVKAAGKFDYISPEGLTNPEHMDPRSDLYSLGALAWELVTGVTPNKVFEEPEMSSKESIDPGQQMRHHLYELLEMFKMPLRHPHELVEGVDETLSEILWRLCQTDPDKRYRSAGELAVDVSRYIHKDRGPTDQSVKAYLAFRDAVNRFATEDLLNEIVEGSQYHHGISRDYYREGPTFKKMVNSMLARGMNPLELLKDLPFFPEAELGQKVLFQQFNLTDRAAYALSRKRNPTRDYD